MALTVNKMILISQPIDSKYWEKKTKNKIHLYYSQDIHQSLSHIYTQRQYEGILHISEMTIPKFYDDDNGMISQKGEYNKRRPIQLIQIKPNEDNSWTIYVEKESQKTTFSI